MPNFDSFGFNGETSNGDGKPTDDMTDLGIKALLWKIWKPIMMKPVFMIIFIN